MSPVKLACLAVLALLTSGAPAAAAPKQEAADTRRLNAALAALRPQRPGVVDAFVIVVALHSDPVFGREAREAGRVLARRFDAAGRTIVLARDEGQSRADARGSPQNLGRALARAAELMNLNEDVLVLYTTTHGLRHEGMVWHDPAGAAAIVSPSILADMINSRRIQNRLIILQACYSGQFVPVLESPRSIIATAASRDRPSFGCAPGNDWTLYGDALVNNALRRVDSLPDSFRNAHSWIAQIEQMQGLPSSNPQLSIGSETAAWLAALESRAPNVPSEPVGQPVTGSGR